MNETWQRFLEDAGAVVENGRVTAFRKPEPDTRKHEPPTVIADLSHFGLIGVAGADATAFLHRQFINDVAGLPRHRWQLNGYCTPKGRLVATFKLAHFGDGLMLVLPAAMTDLLTRRLKPYVLRDDVQFRDLTAENVAIGLAGPDAASVLVNAGVDVPTDSGAVTVSRGLHIFRLPGPVPRFELYGDVPSARSLWHTLTSGDNHTASAAAPVGSDIWEALNIQSGTPIVYPETAELFVPQMLNLDRIGGLSLKKGCYPGQEIVARTQHRGQIKRRMYLAHADTDALPEPGTTVYLAAESESGAVVTAARSTVASGIDMLIVLPIGIFERAPVRLYDKHGPLIEQRALPYRLTDNGS